MSYRHSHFENKSAYEHVKEARKKGLYASLETHGVEMSGQTASFLDNTKTTIFFLQLTFLVCTTFSFPSDITWKILLLVCIGILIWKTGRSALLGWGRLGRLHRLIEEERWEIEHHREQEREELLALYEIKGFKGKLLEEVVDVLMADDNRLLQVMLEEELGLQLGVYEHPLKQASGAFLGVLFSSLLFFAALFISFTYATYGVTFLVIAFCSYHEGKKQKSSLSTFLTWTLAIAATALGLVHFLSQVFV